jgi:glycosyltransferase involved in cell wall biosynthesis
MKRLRGNFYKFVGALLEAIRKALALIVPSECYENAPISVLEALAYGKSVPHARIGGIPEMVEIGVHGYLFEPGNSIGLQQKLKMVLESAETKISDMGQAARRRVERNYTPEIHYEKLMEVYQRAINQIR